MTEYQKDPDKIISYILGTEKSIQDAVDALNIGPLTGVQKLYIEDNIFMCYVCGTWYDVEDAEEHEGSLMCSDCYVYNVIE